MKEFIDTIIYFIKKDILIKDLLAPLRIIALLYIIVSFYLPVGWSFIKTTILLLLNSFYSGPILNGTNGLSLFATWWIYIIDISIVTYLFYVFIQFLNKKGAKKLFALLPILGFIIFIFLFVIIIAVIDKNLPFINLYNTMQIIDSFLK
jgi:amino acid transporter